MKFVFILGWWLWPSVARSAHPSYEAKLYHDLMSNYTKEVKPTIDGNKQLVVNINFGLAGIERLDGLAEEMTSVGYVVCAWLDETLSWNPAQYGQLTSMIIPAKKIWLPEMTIYNSVQDPYDASLESRFRAQVDNFGFVEWSPAFRWVTSCEMDMTNFPFDEQVCTIQIVNWVYTTSLLNYTVQSGAVTLNAFRNSSEWILVYTYATQKIFKFYVSQLNDYVDYNIVYLVVRVKRAPTFFVLTILGPCALLTILSILQFWLPADADERISMGITVFLAYSIVMLSVTEATPRNQTMPIILYFIVTTMGTSALSLMATLGVLNIHCHSPHTPIPQWARKLFLRRLAHILHVQTQNDWENNINKVQPSAEEKNPGGLNSFDVKGVPDAPDLPNDMVGINDANPASVEKILHFIKFYKDLELEKAKIERNRAEWEEVARVVDKIFLAIFASFPLILAVVVCLPLMLSSAKISTFEF